MINNPDIAFLRRKSEDETFHSSRIMFCIKDGKVKIAPRNTVDSHIEWFEKEGWITEENVKDFLKRTIRGFYFPKQNKLYCYKDVGFFFDDKVLPGLLDEVKELKEKLNLNDNTEIHLGPKDSPLYGKEYQRVFAGTLKDLSDKK